MLISQRNVPISASFVEQATAPSCNHLPAIQYRQHCLWLKYSKLPLSIKHQIQLANLYFCELVPCLKFKRSTIIWLCIESYSGIIVMYIILCYEYSNMHHLILLSLRGFSLTVKYANAISPAASAHSYKPWYYFRL